MSGIGKTTTGYSKQDYQESKLLALGFKKTRFAHKATAGATGINFSALVAPPEMSSNGFVQPSLSALIAANLYTYNNNVSISSSLRGPLENNFDYQIASNSQINFIGFTAAQDEVFVGKIDPVSLIGNLVVDGTAQPTTGILAVAATDFNVGLPFSINLYPSTQVGAYTLYRNGRIQVRNSSNSPSGVGNYYEVPVSGGLGFIVRFNIPGVLLPDGSNETIVAIPTGLLVERPQNSMLASIENIAGQLDQVIPTVAALAGVPTSTFQTAPNNVDLKAFGDLVLALQAQINAPLPRFRASLTPDGVPGTFTGTNVSIISALGPTGYDNKGGYNTSTGKYTVQENGVYQLLAGVGIFGNGLINYQVGVQLYVNAVAVASKSIYYQTSYSGGGEETEVNATMELHAGDKVWYSGDFNVSGAAWIISDPRHYFEVVKIGNL